MRWLTNMTEQMNNWLRCYLNSGDGRACTIEHYPDVAIENVSSKAANLKRKLQDKIINGLHGKLAQDAPQMLNTLKDIALNKHGNVRPSEQLKAASEWLSRSGLDAALKVEVRQEERTHEQLVNRVKQLTNTIDIKQITEGKDDERLQH